MSEQATNRAHVELSEIFKSYGGVHAVRDVSFTIARGSVHAIVGENGAGKSTISKIMAGVVAPSAGRLTVAGRRVQHYSPRHALESGIAMMDQELAMVPARSVMENVFLGVESHRAGLLRPRDLRRRFKELLRRTGFDLDGDACVGSLRLADQQKVEILRAVARNAELIIMDEPTAPLTMVESEQLYEIIRGLRDQGTTIVYISHFLGEVLQISDTVTVMRDGEHVRTRPAAEETEESLVRAMLGRSLELAFPERIPCAPSVDPLLQVRNLTAAGRFSDVGFDLRPGEIVGLAGLIGSGRTEVARAVFGADGFDSGTVVLDGRPISRGSPRGSIERGLVLLPESRQKDGLVMMRSISENVVMASLGDVSSFGLLRRGGRQQAVEHLMRDLGVRASGPDALVSGLSGGNQQKVLFAKCLMGGPRVLLVDEPTRGVDVGAKRAIYELLVSLAAQGMAILVISSDVEEVLGLAHRVLVMRRGRLVAELQAAEANEERVLAAAFGAVATTQ
ncbi:sugar ABC transporter ATP-binding protein [Streptomyces sp. NPDC057474]|uniref:sugar ABC transporter ATP-binding protein n=1 Tax=Streptomyces sp. NPDC057474 TaxID=3346144 RepID=UPI0036CE5BC6